jgi:hypothetical protein
MRALHRVLIAVGDGRRMSVLRTTFPAIATAAALSLGAGCSDDHTARPAPTPKPTPQIRSGEAARAAAAVRRLEVALRRGDVERLCAPDDVFTRAVVEQLGVPPMSCEATVEISPALSRAPRLAVDRIRLRPDLATAAVRVDDRPPVALDLVRGQRRWLVSFSNGADPLVAVATGR